MDERARVTRVVDAVHTLAHGARRAAVLEVLAREGHLSGPMAAWALDSTTARYTPEAASQCASGFDLDGRDVAVILAASVATAPLRAVVLPCLRGARTVLVRPSRRQPELARIVVDALASSGLPVAIATEPDPAVFVDGLMRRRGVQVVVAYGDDATVNRLGASLPEHVDFEGYGHGFGVAVVSRESSSDRRAISGLARDIAHYDQFGCLSPQVIFVEGAGAGDVALALHQELDSLELSLPRGPLDAGLASRENQWRGACAAVAAEFHRGKKHAVVLLGSAQLLGSPGGRNVCVVPVARLEEIGERLGSSARHLTNIGVAGSGDLFARLSLSQGVRPRVVATGEMQDPPLDGPEDIRPPVGRAAHDPSAELP